MACPPGCTKVLPLRRRPSRNRCTRVTPTFSPPVSRLPPLITLPPPAAASTAASAAAATTATTTTTTTTTTTGTTAANTTTTTTTTFSAADRFLTVLRALFRPPQSTRVQKVVAPLLDAGEENLREKAAAVLGKVGGDCSGHARSTTRYGGMIGHFRLRFQKINNYLCPYQ